MRMQRLERTSIVPRRRSEVFAFFADARNLEAITPSSLRFSITSPMPVEMRAGARIDYSLALFGVPLRWRTLITLWQPEERFIDEQEAGPYAIWRHLHEFEPHGSSTRMRDVVDYALPFGPLGAVAHELWVRRTLKHIFDHREKAIREHFAGVSGAHSVVSSAS
jgi:ligand-binding SRPBCC domain-containing protein